MNKPFSFLSTVSESRLISNKKTLHEYDQEDLAELAYLHILTLRILLAEDTDGVQQFAYRYCRKTASHGNFKHWYTDGTDIYVMLYGLMSSEATQDKSDLHPHIFMPIEPHLMFRFFRAAGDHALHSDLIHRVFVKLDTWFRIKNSSMRAIRRLVMDWETITHTQKKLALTRLLQFMRNRAPKGELLPWLNRVGVLRDLEIDNVTNPETGELKEGAEPNVFKVACNDSEHLNEINRTAASTLNENKIRENIRIALSVKRKVIGRIGDVRISMGQDRNAKYAIFAKNKIAYGFAILDKAKLDGTDGYYMTEIGLLDEIRYQGIGYAFYKMLLSQHFTLFSGGSQTPDGERTWRKLMRDPDVTIRMIRLSDEGENTISDGDPWADPDVRLIATSVLPITENASAGATCAAGVATVVGGLGAGFDADYSKSVYPAPKKQKPVVMKRAKSLNEDSISRYLESLEQVDQAERNAYMAFVKANGGDYEQGAALYAKKHNRPTDDVFGEKARNIAFIAKAKSFDFKQFSEKDWDNFWLVTQHCDFDRDFQKLALSIIKQHQGVEHSHYKYLYDRISCGCFGKQKYGTQDKCKKDSDL